MDQLNNPLLFLARHHLSQIISIAEQHSPQESCGIIAGCDHTSQKIYQISNSLNSPAEYLMAPKEMIKAFWEIENNDWEPIAFFHSHPASPPIPSSTDLDRNYYQNIPHLIIGREQGKWSVRGFLLSKTNFTEILLKII